MHGLDIALTDVSGKIGLDFYQRVDGFTSM